MQSAFSETVRLNGSRSVSQKTEKVGERRRKTAKVGQNDGKKTGENERKMAKDVHG